MTSAHFPNRLAGYFEDDRRRFTLTEDFAYIDEDLDIRVVVPAGFTTDWNSVPTPAWAYFAPWEYPEAGLVHDWLYRNPGAFARVSGDQASPLTRRECDGVHRRILELKGCRWTKRQVIWSFLLAGGWAAWAEHRAADAPNPS